MQSKARWRDDIADSFWGPWIVTKHAWDWGIILCTGFRGALFKRVEISRCYPTRASAKRHCERLDARLKRKVKHAK